MTRNEDHFERFGLHTLCKHQLLERYLTSWVAKLGLDGREHRKLLLVDAFAGAGGDLAGNPGSPLIMVKAAKEMEAAVSAIRRLRVQVEVVLIEEKENVYQQLEERISGLDTSWQRRVKIHRGTLAEHMPRLDLEHSSTPAFCFVDPYGIIGIDVPVLQQFLAVPRREVLIQFNAHAAHRIASTLRRERPKQEERRRREWMELDLFTDNEASRKEHERKIALGRIALRAGQRVAVHALNQIFGVTGDPESLPTESVGYIQLLEERLAHGGAPYLTRLPIYNEDDQLQYVLLHASPHPVGRRTIKECYQTILNKGPLPASALAAMRDAASGPCDDAFIELREAFAGRTAHWSRDVEGSLGQYLLQETALFPWQLKEVQSILGSHGWRAPGENKIRYSIPPLET
jgi:three-Cys-motif partner protein